MGTPRSIDRSPNHFDKLFRKSASLLKAHNTLINAPLKDGCLLK